MQQQYETQLERLRDQEDSKGSECLSRRGS